MENRKEIVRLASEIEELKAKAKLDEGYRFDVRPHRRDSEKWQHIMRTDFLTRELIKERLKEIWHLHKEDAHREVETSVCEMKGRSPLPLPIGMLLKKETAGYKGDNAV